MLPVLLASEGDGEPQVTRVGNDIYFYCPVDTVTCLELIKLLKEVDSYPQWNVATSSLRPITLHIHSPGGDLISAFAIADVIEQLDSHIISIIEGWCASAATLISMACDERKMTKRSHMMIHQMSIWFQGTFEEWKDNDKVEEMFIEQLRIFYVDHSFMSMKKITKMLQHDFWMGAEEALKKGFVDEIL